MTDAAQQANPTFEVQRIYLKDLSFESPTAPAVFTREFKPEAGVELHSGNRKLGEDVYEVEIHLTLTVKSGDEVAYLVEVKEAGIFTLKGYEQEQLGPLLGAYCPNMLYPFVREVISDVVVKGGFPQQLLAPINFDALYAQHLQEQAAEQKGDGETH
ncbi:MAG: protein-export chaperone SecB [Thiotrichales bacterium]